MSDTGLLQVPRSWGGTSIILVPVVNEYADRWLARYDGKWRRVHIQVRRLYIVHRGKRITIGIEGV